MPLLRRRPILLVVPLLVVAAVAAWLLLLQEDDPYDPVRDLDAVERVGDWLNGRGTNVVLRRGSDIADVRAAIDALPEERRGARLVLRSVTLEVDRDDARAARAAAPALVAAADVDGRIEIDTRSGAGELEAWVKLADQAPPLARALVQAGIGPEQGIATMEVKAERSPQRYDETPLTLDLGSPSGFSTAAIFAVRDLAGRGVSASTHGGQLEVRVFAPGPDEAAGAFRAASASLADAAADVRDASTIYVDVRDTGRGPWSTLPMLQGRPGSSPDRALALVERLESGGGAAFARTDLGYVRAELPGRDGTQAAAQAARAAGADRVEVVWELPTATMDWTSPVAGARRGEGTVDDDAATVVRVLRGAERAREKGIEAVRWIAPRAGEVGPPRLTVTRPGWIVGTGPLAEEGTAALRRLFRAVRAVDWPGSARLTFMLGPDACGKGTNRYAAVELVSTADGRARQVDGGSSCDVEDQIDTVRAAWDGTAR